MTCPRQTEATMEVQRRAVVTLLDDGTCSYCGSLSQEVFLAAVDAGCQLGPTDKEYKVYVDRPDPRAGEPYICGTANFRPDYGEGWTEVTSANVSSLPGGRSGDMRAQVGHWVQVSKRPAMKTDKFYFQHLDEAGRRRFVELLNAKALNIAPPGRFYVLPFFCVRVK